MEDPDGLLGGRRILWFTSLSETWERSVRQPLATWTSRGQDGHALAIPAIALAIFLLHRLLTRELGYSHVYGHDEVIVALIAVFIVFHLISQRWRIPLLVGVSVAWHVVLTPWPVAALLIGSASGTYMVLRNQNIGPVSRGFLLAPPVAGFIFANWLEYSHRLEQWTILGGLYMFGWGAMTLRFMYVLGEGRELRRGVAGDSLAAFLVFLLFFPFTLFIIAISYCDFVRRTDRHTDMASRLRGLELAAIAVLKYFVLVQWSHLLNGLRMEHASTALGAGGEYVLLWLEVATPYVQAYLFLSMSLDLGTAWARLFGWNLEPAFRNPLLARNMKDLWVRWNVYLRQGLVNLCYYPLIRAAGNPNRLVQHVLALVLACLATFLLSAAYHVVFFGWPGEPTVMYFVLQAIPVAFILVREHLSLRRARRLKRRIPQPDPWFTPLFILCTFTYQSLLHQHFSDPVIGGVWATLAMMCTAPLRLLVPAMSLTGLVTILGIVGLIVTRHCVRKHGWSNRRQLSAVAFMVAAAMALSMIVWSVSSEPISRLRAWSLNHPVSAAWSLHEGLALIRQNRTEEAIIRLQQALEFQSQPEEARRLLAELQSSHNSDR